MFQDILVSGLLRIRVHMKKRHASFVLLHFFSFLQLAILVPPIIFCLFRFNSVFYLLYGVLRKFQSTTWEKVLGIKLTTIECRRAAECCLVNDLFPNGTRYAKKLPCLLVVTTTILFWHKLHIVSFLTKKSCIHTIHAL